MIDDKKKKNRSKSDLRKQSIKAISNRFSKNALHGYQS